MTTADALAKGIEEFNNGNYSECLDYFNIVMDDPLRTDEQKSKPNLYIGIMLWRGLGTEVDIEGAEEWLRSAVDVNPFDLDAIRSLGLFYMETGNYNKAIWPLEIGSNNFNDNECLKMLCYNYIFNLDDGLSALEYANKLVKNGVGAGYGSLAYIYTGETSNVKRDLKIAEQWAEQGVMNGSKECKELLADIREARRQSSLSAKLKRAGSFIAKEFIKSELDDYAEDFSTSIITPRNNTKG